MTPVARALLLRKIRGTVGAAHAEARQHFERRYGPAMCRDGCAFCCYSKVLVTITEGAAIYLYLRSEGLWNAELEARLVSADAELTPVSHADWLPKRKPCVFLDETAFGQGRCTVYPARPSGCATAFSIAPDASDCAAVDGEYLVSVVMRTQTMQTWVLDMTMLMKAMGLDGFFMEVVMTLPAAVLQARTVIEGLPARKLLAVSMLVAKNMGVSAMTMFDELGAARAGAR